MSRIDLEQGTTSDTSVDESVCFSDADEGSCYSSFFSTAGGSFNEYMFDYVFDHVFDSRRASFMSDCSVVVENYVGASEVKVDIAKLERDCRICHLSLENSDHDNEIGIGIELGCACKNDLAAAHKHCAEQWFKIKGNLTCEICNSIAKNVACDTEVSSAERSNETISVTATSSVVASPTPVSETRSCWQGRRFLNMMLACMVLAFVISWLFHFHLPSN